jgi:hypothetical protein
MQEERSTMTTTWNQQALMASMPTETTGQEEEEEKEEAEVVVEEEEDYNDLSSVELLFLVQWFVVPVQHEKKIFFNKPSEMAIQTNFYQTIT